MQNFYLLILEIFQNSIWVKFTSFCHFINIITRFARLKGREIWDKGWTYQCYPSQSRYRFSDSSQMIKVRRTSIGVFVLYNFLNSSSTWLENTGKLRVTRLGHWASGLNKIRLSFEGSNKQIALEQYLKNEKRSYLLLDIRTYFRTESGKFLKRST